MVGRVVLVVAGLAIAGVAIFFAIRELNEVSEVTPGQQPGAAVGGARTVIVRMKDDEFEPDNVSIRAGQTVRWVNADDSPHTVTSLPSAEAQFDSGRLERRETYEEAFEDIGLYRYESTIDRGMEGRVTVLGD